MPYVVDDEHKARRLACPNGHRHVGPTNDHWLCRSCAQAWQDCDPEFDEIVDRKTGETYRRDEIEFDFEVPGVYYA